MDAKNTMPPPSWAAARPRFQSAILVGFSILTFLLFTCYLAESQPTIVYRPRRPPNASEIKARCRNLRLRPTPPRNFYQRRQSDRYEKGTKPVLIKNAKIWTGGFNGGEIVHGDVLMENGIITKVGRVSHRTTEQPTILDANGSWITPGIVDIHSHIGVESSPALDGATDGNSLKGTIQPWLRSLDGLNTHDAAYNLSIAGGVTTSLVLPGSANAIGGQAFVIKLRKTSEKSASSMLLEPPHTINSSSANQLLPPRWRHLKQACGENPSGAYGSTRMDSIWAMREAYAKAAEIKSKQDNYCAHALADDWSEIEEFPESFEWEMLIDVLRGRVKVNTHCYEAVDLDNLVRLSNEFEFEIAAFHHAAETYLVPDLLKKAYGKPPAAALFAAFGRYKREAYRFSEYAPRILAQNGITVLMKSDHPAINSRYLIHEARQAHYYGLSRNRALASVTSNAAETMGFGHRIGYIKEGFDADLVIWDSHPLALGATPTQVFIDGIAQLESPYVVPKPKALQNPPVVPNFNREAEQAVLHDGLQPLTPRQLPINTPILFSNVGSLYRRRNGTVEQVFGSNSSKGTCNPCEHRAVAVQQGKIVCYGAYEICSKARGMEVGSYAVIDLEGGSISPSFVSVGTSIGLEHINQEPSTGDGYVSDPLSSPPSGVLGDSAIIRAVDGLQYGSRDALTAYRSGVTTAITAPMHAGFLSGLGTAFGLGAPHKLAQGAVVQDITAVHVSIRHTLYSSISTQIAALRHLLLGKGNHGDLGNWFGKVAQGEIPLVVETHSADIIATLIVLKGEVEAQTRRFLCLTIEGGSEAHLLAQELARAKVGVVLKPGRSFPSLWEGQQILPGPPLSNQTSAVTLIAHGVLVGIAPQGIGFDCFWPWAAKNLPFDLGWLQLESGGMISKAEAIALGSVNLEQLLGVRGQDDASGDLVVTSGGDILGFEGRVAVIISPRQGVSHWFVDI